MIGLVPSPPEDRPLAILCLGAHADDIEIGCGGTILSLLALRPARVHWVVFGASGERADEARGSAAAFTEGATASEVVIHSFRDGYFPAQREAIKEAFESMKEAFSPDLVFVHDEADLHQDHALLGALARETFRDHLILGYEVPKYDGGLRSPNLFVPLEAKTAERKIRSLMEGFPSQRPKRWFVPETFEALMRLRGVECAAPAGYAEGFHARKLRLIG